MIFDKKILMTNAILQLCTCYCLVYEKINFECLLTNWLHVLSLIQKVFHSFPFVKHLIIKVEYAVSICDKNYQIMGSSSLFKILNSLRFSMVFKNKLHT